MKIIVLLLLLISIHAHADIFDMSEHSGIIKDSSGNYYKVNSQGTISAIKTGTSLAVTEKINIPTSKGSFATDLVRTAPIDIPRIGASVAAVAKLAGPIGLTLTAVDLVCSLSSICKSASEWLFTQTDFGGIAAGHYPSCQESIGLPAGSTFQDCTNIINANPGVYFFRIPKVPPTSANCINRGGVSWTYTAFAYTCTNAPVTTRPVDDNDWNTAASKLNDIRFVDSFLEKGNPVPVGTPTITNPINVPLGSETTTTKDGAGNVTGTQTTIKNAQISQPSSSENPTNSPSLIKITENTTINNYNTNNQLTSSTSTVTNNPVPVQEPPKQEPITISIDNVPDQALQTYAVPGTFSFTSWGSGSCPADKTWSTMFGTHAFSYELTCDFATTFRPILLAIAAIVSFMIVASTRTE